MTPDRVALVTGCGKKDGVGREVAHVLARAGHTVVVTDRLATGVLNRRQERLGEGPEAGWRGVDSVVEEIEAAGGRASSALGDVGVEEDADRMVATAVERYGRLDVLVNNAAAPQGFDRQDIEDVPIEVWDEVIRINLRGTYLMCRAAVAAMRRNGWGRIINVSSMAGVVAAPWSTAYSASKAGIIGFSRSLSMDVAGDGITVNCICPGAVGTSRSVISDDPSIDVAAELERRGQGIAVGRVGMPEDIAAAAGYLASDGAAYMTGQILVLDGGGHRAFPLRRRSEAPAAAARS